MVPDVVSVFNLALNAVSARNNVAHPDERSREAEVCRLWFGPVRDQVLRAAPWPSAKGYYRLPVLKERDDTLDWQNTDPEPDYRFAYGCPEDMINPRYLQGFRRFTLGNIVQSGNNTRAIMANDENPILCYTRQEIVVGKWDSSLAMAVVLALAAHICSPLTGKRTLVERLLGQANATLIEARVNAANTDMEYFDSVPDWISARGYSGSVSETKFYYPSGELFSLGAISDGR